MAKTKTKNAGTENTGIEDDTLLVNFEEMTREELLKVAAEYGLNPAEEASNEDIIKAVKAAYENPSAQDEENAAGADETPATDSEASGSVDSSGTDVQPPPSGGGNDNLGDSSEEDEEEVSSPAVPPSPPSGGKKRVQCDRLKGGKKITVGKDIVQADEDGVIEVEEKEAERLLTVPGYQEA